MRPIDDIFVFDESEDSVMKSIAPDVQFCETVCCTSQWEQPFCNINTRPLRPDEADVLRSDDPRLLLETACQSEWPVWQDAEQVRFVDRENASGDWLVGADSDDDSDREDDESDDDQGFIRTAPKKRQRRIGPRSKATPLGASYNFLVGQLVRIIHGEYGGKGYTGEIKRSTEEKLHILFDGTNGEIRTVSRRSVIPMNEEGHRFVGQVEYPAQRTRRRGNLNTTSRRSQNRAASEFALRTKSDAALDKWKYQGSDEREMHGGRIIVKYTLSSDRKVEKIKSFLDYKYGPLLRCIECPITQKEGDEPHVIAFKDPSSGQNCWLLSSKTADDEQGKGFRFYQAPKNMRMVYLMADTLQACQEELEKLGNFACCSKAHSRLELLQTVACQLNGKNDFLLGQISLDTLEEIEENGHEGCGFICEEYLQELLGPNTRASQEVVAIQVRIIAPELGIFKGMLMAKRFGVDQRSRKILLPPSMKKVEASIHPERISNTAFMIIRRVSPSTTNKQLAKIILDDSDETPKSFTVKELAPMFERLFVALGVNDRLFKQYVQDCTKTRRPRHAWLVGVADPTGELPVGTVYVPGLGIRPRQIFVTRSPCMEPDDGRMIDLVSEKPAQMSAQNWEWLENLPLSVIIFATPEPGTLAIPPQIADGDLDGDLYLVCWNLDFLVQLKTTPINTRKSIPPAGKRGPHDPDPNWLKKAQEKMVDAPRMVGIDKLVRALYKAATSLGPLHNKDVIALGRAYKDALCIGKHGGNVYLPEHLHDHINDQNLRSMFLVTDRSKAFKK